jgi:hypothetical protein
MRAGNDRPRSHSIHHFNYATIDQPSMSQVPHFGRTELVKRHHRQVDFDYTSVPQNNPILGSEQFTIFSLLRYASSE